MSNHISLFIRQRNIREPAEYRRRRREAQRETFETPPTQCDYCTLTFGRLIPSFFFQKFRKWRSTVYAITHSRLAESMHSQSVSNLATNESQPLEMTAKRHLEATWATTYSIVHSVCSPLSQRPSLISPSS
jgi:hypothetical protein